MAVRSSEDGSKGRSSRHLHKDDNSPDRTTFRDWLASMIEALPSLPETIE